MKCLFLSNGLGQNMGSHRRDGAIDSLIYGSTLVGSVFLFTNLVTL